MDEEDQPRAPEHKVAQARALWEIALIYLALGAVARALLASASPGTVAASGYRAGQLLAHAYYRLLRAIWTGHTFEGRVGAAGERTSLYELYSDFETLAYRVIPETKHADTRRRVRLAADNYDKALEDLVPEREDHELADDRFEAGQDYVDAAEEFSPEETEDYAADEPDDDEWSRERDILIERIDELDALIEEREQNQLEVIDELSERLRKAQEAERKREREAKRAEKRRTDRGSEKPKSSREMDAKERRALARAERAVAIMKGAQSGARDEVNSLVKADNRALGWVRVPHGPNPCGWCLMLASRGIIYYKSAANARAGWHENCHCTAEPIFSRNHFFTSPLFAKNRALFKLWQDHGFGKGRQGEKDFRNFFLRQYRNGRNIGGIIAENAEQHNTPSQED